MPSMFRFLALLVVGMLIGHVAAVSPIQRVLQMMEDMKAKGVAEKNEEEIAFKTLLQFCKDTDAAKSAGISDADDRMDKLQADIEKSTSDAQVLGEEMDKLDQLIQQAKADKQSSHEQYVQDEADYTKLHGEYELNIEELQQGIEDVQMQSMMVRGASAASAAAAGSSFLQKMADKKTLPAFAKQALVAFLATSSKGGSKQPSGQGAFDGVLEVIRPLQDKLREELAKLEKDWVKTTGSYQMLQQTFANQIDEHTTMRTQKAITKKEKEAAAEDAQGDLGDTGTMQSEDKVYLKDVHSECAEKSSHFEKRQGLRAGEIRALSKAIEIMSGSAVTGLAQKPQAVQAPATSLAQFLRSGEASDLSNQQKVSVARFLQKQSQRYSSSTLAALSLQVAADPLAKVKKMIQDMVVKLMEEANAEAEQKGFCDAEMGKNKMTRDEKTTAIEELTASIDEMTAAISQLGLEVADLSARLGDIDAAVQEATALRQAEKAKNTATIEEAVAATTAVRQALDVLNEYYQSASASAASLLQSHSSEGVLGMLEVILSDFVRLETSTRSNEATSQREYDRFTADSNQDRAIAKQQVQDKSQAKTETDVSLAEAHEDLESTQGELDAANIYYEKLKPQCQAEEASYEDRVARRKAEIESLKQALKMLEL